LVRKLPRFAALADGDMQALVSAIGATESLSADEDCLMEGDPARGCAVVLDGLLCSYKILPDGKRQILAFLIAGDTFGLSATILGHTDHSVAAVIPSRIATIPQSKLRDLFANCPRISQALWQDMLVQNAISREWIANVGQRNAYQRISHLLCEMRVRFEAAGLSAGARFPWPITQAGIGDAAGLSIVHVNRTLQRMRADGLITLQDGEVTVHAQEELEDVAGFDPGYLYLNIQNRKTERPMHFAMQ
jgi:CRP-like cAMP-binding protein